MNNNHLIVSIDFSCGGPRYIYWTEQPPVLPNRLRPAPGRSVSLIEQVLVLMIIRSVLMLGRRTFGVTTPHASLSRRFIDSVHFFDRFEGTCGGNAQGDPKAVDTRLWWLGAISCGKLATINSSANMSSTWLFFLAEHSTKTQEDPCELQKAIASSAWTVLSAIGIHVTGFY